jgi:hypothetical protein
MLNSGEKKFVLYATKKINILTLVLSEKKILNETKDHTPLLQVKWSVPNIIISSKDSSYSHVLLLRYLYYQCIILEIM